MQPRVIILDRDGTINVEQHYLSDPAQVELLPHAAEGMRQMRAQGCRLVIVTNQSGIGRGYFDERRLDAIHRRLRKLLAEEGVEIDAIYYCPHVPDDHCQCRKPEPGMLEQAARELGFEMQEAVVIGDKLCDIELGQRVGATTILVETGYGREVRRHGQATADYDVADLTEAAAIVCDELSN